MLTLDREFYWATVRETGRRILLDRAKAEKAMSARRSKYVDIVAARTHQCCKCGKIDLWRSGWLWHGSIEDLDNGVAVKKFCPKCAPKDAQIIDASP